MLATKKGIPRRAFEDVKCILANMASAIVILSSELQAGARRVGTAQAKRAQTEFFDKYFL